METTEKNTPKREELIIKFGKGLVGKPFMAKTGKECVGIKIPNADPADKTPWESIVVGANRVHEDKFGKGMWMKLPVDGQTRVSRSVITGQDESYQYEHYAVYIAEEIPSGENLASQCTILMEQTFPHTPRAHVQSFGSSALSDNDTIRSHSECVYHKILYGDPSGTF